MNKKEFKYFLKNKFHFSMIEVENKVDFDFLENEYMWYILKFPNNNGESLFNINLPSRYVYFLNDTTSKIYTTIEFEKYFNTDTYMQKIEYDKLYFYIDRFKNEEGLTLIIFEFKENKIICYRGTKIYEEFKIFNI
jgi:hypothetical protein